MRLTSHVLRTLHLKLFTKPSIFRTLENRGDEKLLQEFREKIPLRSKEKGGLFVSDPGNGLDDRCEKSLGVGRPPAEKGASQKTPNILIRFPPQPLWGISNSPGIEFAGVFPLF